MIVSLQVRLYKSEIDRELAYQNMINENFFEKY